MRNGRGEHCAVAPIEVMPRVARAEFEPGLYHAYARGNRKQAIYLDDHDRRRYLALLARTVEKTGWRCLAYCLMSNHMHLLIETRKPNLGVGMHRLQGGYAQYFNRRHGFRGRLFDDRYNAVPIQSDPQLWVSGGATLHETQWRPACARRLRTGSGAAIRT